MGDPRKLRKKYMKPRHPWQAGRITEEKDFTRQYGVKNKREIWRASSKVRKWRQQARKITEMRGELAEKEKNIIITKLQKLGVLGEKADLENVLDLKVEDLLERRLQTQVFKKGLASSVKQARQFITHQKVMINGKIVTSPSYVVKLKDNLDLTAAFKKKLAAPPKKKKVVKEEEENGQEE
ncbi:MAG: 30S ribosomal protein S4 [Candidatus Woesearchaeota archaeon]|nr:MAG: 30S ribosomal protein S4 [Candidatus Woesearchaeota archaeon]